MQYDDKYNKEQKLIDEIIDHLYAATEILRDLTKLISDKNEQMLFLDEAKEVYCEYIEDVRSDFKRKFN
jgi:hypothetical protein